MGISAASPDRVGRDLGCVALPLSVGAAVLDCNFVLAWVLPGASRSLTTVVSDLAAADSPWNWVFRAGDALSAVLLLWLAVLAWQVCAGRLQVAWRVATVLTAVFAAATLVAAVVVPESCTDRPGCPTSGQGDWVSWVHAAVAPWVSPARSWPRWRSP